MSDQFRSDQNFLTLKVYSFWSILHIRQFRHLLVCLISVIVQNSLKAEIRWTPDGQWLAFRQVTSNQPLKVFEPGWIFNPSRFIAPKPDPDIRSTEPSLHTIWVGRADLQVWHKMATSEIFLSDPAWSPDGKSLFYAAVEKSSDKKLYWRIRQVSSFSKSKNSGLIVWEKPLPDDWRPKTSGKLARAILGQLQVGTDSLLIFADPIAEELLLFKADSQEIVTRFPNGHLAKISPTGESVAWLRSEIWPSAFAELMITKVSDPVHTSRLRNVMPDSAPIFSADGQAIYIARHQKPPEALNVPRGSDWPELCRVELKSLKTTRYSPLVATPVLPSERLSGISFTLDPDEELLLYSPAISPRPVEIVWFQPKTAATYKRFPPLDLNTPVSSLSISAEDRLALRFGNQDFPLESAELPAALCELISEQIHPFVPDDATGQLWVELLARAIARILYTELPAPEMLAETRIKNRFSLVPTMDEVQGDGPATIRLRRVANVGLRSLGMDPKNIKPTDLERLSAWQIEAAALFLNLTNHHKEALVALEMIRPTTLTGTDRARLIAMKAQEEIANGNPDQASMILTELMRFEPKILGSLESDGAGGLRLEKVRPDAWSEYLQKMSAAAANPPSSAEGKTPLNPLGHFNPDDPENDLDLKMQPPQPERFR
jgi:hypothetical protein